MAEDAGPAGARGTAAVRADARMQGRELRRAVTYGATAAQGCWAKVGAP